MIKYNSLTNEQCHEIRNDHVIINDDEIIIKKKYIHLLYKIVALNLIEYMKDNNITKELYCKNFILKKQNNNDYSSNTEIYFIWSLEGLNIGNFYIFSNKNIPYDDKKMVITGKLLFDIV